MKRRVTKKCECAHFYYGPRFLVTVDPYPIYNSENYCKAGRFDWTWGNHDGEDYPCSKCNGFKLSRQKIRERRVESKEIKESFRKLRKYAKYLFDNPEEYVNPLDDVSFDIFKIR